MARLTLHPIARDGTVADFGAVLPKQAAEVCATFIAMYAKTGHVAPWVGHLVSHAGVCIGTCAFTSAPKEGRVEIAYFTFSDFEGRGYATEMAQHLVALAAKTDPAVRVFAHTSPEENASTAILRKVGFTLTGPIEHPEDGVVWEWDLEPQAPDPLAAARAKAEATYNAASDHFDDAPLAFWDVYGRRTVERLRLAKGSAVLDVCCGAGASAIPAAEIVGPAGSVLAVDLADRLLARAREKAAHRKLDNVEFRVGDMTRLGQPDGAFAAVVIVFGIFFVPDMEAQVRELWRMVAPGGKLAVTTWGPRVFEPMHAVWKRALKNERADLSAAFNPWDRIASEDAVRRLLVDGGATNVEVVAEEGRHALSCPEDWWTIALGSGLRWAIDAMTAEERARVREANLEHARRNRVESVETNVIYGVATKALR